MASLQINTLATSRAFTQITEVDGQSYLLAFRFNARDGKWRWTITFEDTLLVRSLPLVEDTDVLRNFDHIENIPLGTFLVVDLDGLGRDPDAETFGDRVILRYDEAA